MEKLTRQEEEVMLHIWTLKECFIKDILARYAEPKPPYTTLASIVTNLKRKGYVKQGRVGNTYLYTPLISEQEYKRTFMSGFVRNYFENSYKEMVSFFAKEQKISADDLQDILQMIEQGKEKPISSSRCSMRSTACSSTGTRSSSGGAPRCWASWPLPLWLPCLGCKCG